MTKNNKILSGDRKWSSYLFEFIIVFASLYLTFELENYGEYQNNREKEKLYLASLERDLDKDVNQLNRRIVDYDDKIEKAYQLLEKIEGGFQRNSDSITYFYRQALQYNFLYNPINNTFESLKSSGDLKLVINPKFKILLSELDKSYKATLASGHTYEGFINSDQWIGFLSLNFDQTQGQLTPLGTSAYVSIRFHNLISHVIKLLEEYQYSVQGTLKKTLEVQTVLKEEMTRRSIPTLQNGEDIENQELF